MHKFVRGTWPTCWRMWWEGVTTACVPVARSTRHRQGCGRLQAMARCIAGKHFMEANLCSPMALCRVYFRRHCCPRGFGGVFWVLQADVASPAVAPRCVSVHDRYQRNKLRYWHSKHTSYQWYLILRELGFGSSNVLRGAAAIHVRKPRALGCRA